MSKKLETIIHRANGGNHSPVNYRKHMNMLLDHPYSNGRLYHIVFTGSEDPTVYRKAVELLCKQLRAKGMPCHYKACYERDKFKRFHKHVFLLIEANIANPDTIIHFRKGHWFTKTTEDLGLAFTIAQPLDPMHQVAGKKVNYAYVPKKASPKLDDCLIWISYLTKVRSKAGVECQTYTGSTNRKAKKPIPPSAALPAGEEERITLNDVKLIIPETGNNVVSHKPMKNSAGQTYLADTKEVPSVLTFYPEQDKTMSSVEIVDVINAMRGPGKAELRHDDFMRKVAGHPEINGRNFSGIYFDTLNREKPCYYLPKREAELMVMSESLEVQQPSSSNINNPLPDWKGKSHSTEKASHEGITTPQSGTEGQSTGNSTTESRYSAPTLGSTRPGSIAPRQASSSGPTGQAVKARYDDGSEAEGGGKPVSQPICLSRQLA